jgi:hypothetical protein
MSLILEEWYNDKFNLLAGPRIYDTGKGFFNNPTFKDLGSAVAAIDLGGLPRTLLDLRYRVTSIATSDMLRVRALLEEGVLSSLAIPESGAEKAVNAFLGGEMIFLNVLGPAVEVIRGSGATSLKVLAAEREETLGWFVQPLLDSEPAGQLSTGDAWKPAWASGTVPTVPPAAGEHSA